MSMAASPHRFKMARLYVVMGVAGSGKTLIGSMVADAIGGTYIDGDDYHPPSNITKMTSGEPLTDEDRWPWLDVVVAKLTSIDGIVFVGCSALKKSYRDFISDKAGETVTFLYLSGTKELLASRMRAREGHFMPTALLDSQFDTLEIPLEDESTITVDINASPKDITAFIMNEIQRTNDTSV